MRHDASAPSFGLPACVRVPIAAMSIDALTEHVGEPVEIKRKKTGDVSAVKIRAYHSGVPALPRARLWATPEAQQYAAILYPEFQIWVHVDYRQYRSAYAGFGMAPITSETFLDHIQNRRAMRLRWYSHPLLRLCPVSRATNSNSGHADGGEGMEVENMEALLASPDRAARLKAEVFAYKVQYADPADLTKMINVSPGTFVLNGVRDTQHLFYP